MPSAICTLQKSWLKESGTASTNEAVYGKKIKPSVALYKLELERIKALVEKEKK